ncbi:hypothetical protein HX088_11215 [Empedobacter sp. 225-1]|uniref:hypothetical protein n=1 Tax=Empedobacter sp. 225-1 TaxID=2746725 RepID=UPI0025775D7E|nr:hypothetical protein [Empedobacter sp. 225-1]MDM1523835.1 hypothetical protein [Empedobacter sp. 225-1]
MKTIEQKIFKKEDEIIGLAMQLMTSTDNHLIEKINKKIYKENEELKKLKRQLYN